MTREMQKQEAIERMKLLKLHENPIREFEKKDLVNVSEHGGILYWVDDEQAKFIKEFEAKHNAVVYHAILNYTEFGKLLSFLYVSDSEDEWVYDRHYLASGSTVAYVKNLDDDMYSEFGSIGIRPQFGGLARIY